MEPYLMNCVVCLSTNNLHKFGVIGKRKHNANVYEETDENRCVDNQVQVIFLLRKMLDIPNGVCTKFIQEYGNPSSWIYCCSSCSVLVDKARNIFDEMALLQKQFEKVQSEIKEAIIHSVNSEEKVFLNGPPKGPKEILRSYITKEYYGHSSKSQIKEEPQDYEDMDAKSDLDYLDWSPVQTSDDDMDDDDYVPSGNITSYGSKDTNNELALEFVEKQEENEDDNGKIYSCDMCGEDFNQRRSLVKHQMIHEGKMLHECDICKKRFTQFGSLKIHYRIHTKEKPYKCQYCGKGFPDSGKLKVHVRTHTSVENPIVCDICNRQYSNNDTFKAHLKTHDVEKLNSLSIYNCQVCGEEFSQTASLVEHSKMIHNAEIIIHNCETCHKTFIDLAEFDLHKQSPCRANEYSCDICKTTFSTAKGFHIHLKTHDYNDEERFTCQVCGQKFRQPHLLTFHLKKEHEDVIHMYPCRICGKKFVKTTKLKRHMEVHSNVRPLSCNVCGNKFKNAFSLKSHMRTHTGEKAYKCNYCGESFRQLNHLNIHISKQHVPSTSEGDQLEVTESELGDKALRIEPSTSLEQKKEQKEFLCYNCNNKYPNEVDLKEHVKTHAGEFPNQCDCCGKHFIQKKALIIHYRNHTGERPYKCEFCKKSFTQPASLILHRRTHTGERPYTCTVCDKSFSQSSHLYRHQNTHLNEVFVEPS